MRVSHLKAALAVAGVVAASGPALAGVTITLDPLAGQGVLSNVAYSPSVNPNLAEVDFGYFIKTVNRTAGTTTYTYSPTTTYSFDVSEGDPNVVGDDGTATVTGVMAFNMTGGKANALTAAQEAAEPSIRNWPDSLHGPTSAATPGLINLSFSSSTFGTVDTFSFIGSAVYVEQTVNGNSTGITLIEDGTLTYSPAGQPTVVEAASLRWALIGTSGPGGTGVWSAHADLDNPPIDAPEPVAMSILGVSLAGLAFARRRA